MNEAMKNNEVALNENEQVNGIDLCCEAEGMMSYCCGNCRYFDGDSWCGLHRCRTTGGDRCDSWQG